MKRKALTTYLTTKEKLTRREAEQYVAEAIKNSDAGQPSMLQDLERAVKIEKKRS